MRCRDVRVLLIPLLLTACSASAAPPPQAGGFDVFRFFAGRTHGDGRLKILTKGAKSVTVEGRGRIEGDTLVLDQVVQEEGKPPRERRWRIRQDSPGHYSGTLTDAKGPILATIDQGRLHIEFTMQNGMPTEQWLTLSPDGGIAQNRLTVKKLGIVVAALDETITKLD